MIKLILGGVGSGKTLSTIKMMEQSNHICFTGGFDANISNVKRLKVSDIINKVEKKSSVNWAFWNDQRRKLGNFHIFIDEVHNLIHSRRAMSTFNVLMSMWIAQIRKICGNSEKTHFVCISQALKRVDISFRDLTQEIIFCQKKQSKIKIPTVVRENGRRIKKLINKTFILQNHFIGENCIEKFLAFKELRQKTYDYRSIFLGNKYMQYYDSYSFATFGEEEYL